MADQRRPRSDAGRVDVTPRDEHGMSWVVEQYAVPLDLLIRLLGASESATRNVVARWRKAGWVETGRMGAGITWVWGTAAGIARFGRRPYTPHEPSAGRLEHHRGVIEARVFLEAKYADRYPEWHSERELRWELGAVRGSNAAREHLPDGLMEVDTPNGGRGTIVIEVELSPKAVERLKAIFTSLLETYRGDVRIVYFVTERTDRFVRRALLEFEEKNPRGAGRISVDRMPGVDR